MWHRVKWWFFRVRKKLWVRPLLYASLALLAVLAAALADRLVDAAAVPRVDRGTLEDLLAIIASSMLSVATLAVASMVAAYASASSTATPRAFSLVVADDVSQMALSGFIGAFIFSIVALTAVKTGSYGAVGLFVTFSFTVLIFAMVIMIFLRWVDRIARLGRLGHTIDRVEEAARAAIDARRATPLLGGVPLDGRPPSGPEVYSSAIGYVQTINIGAIQRHAEKLDGRVVVEALPGTFVAPGKALATLDLPPGSDRAAVDDIANAFIVGDDRTFEEDPRFGLVTLAEIAARALSPAVNDPGTAIDITGTFVRLFARGVAPVEEAPARFDRVLVPELSLMDMFDDAFTAIARDGAGTVEVGIRLQKALFALASMGDERLRQAAARHAALAVARADQALKLPEERQRIQALASAVGQPRPA
jgi:uncharacterized membrane protein